MKVLEIKDGKIYQTAAEEYCDFKIYLVCDKNGQEKFPYYDRRREEKEKKFMLEDGDLLVYVQDEKNGFIQVEQIEYVQLNKIRESKLTEEEIDVIIKNFTEEEFFFLHQIARWDPESGWDHPEIEEGKYKEIINKAKMKAIYLEIPGFHFVQNSNRTVKIDVTALVDEERLFGSTIVVCDWEGNMKKPEEDGDTIIYRVEVGDVIIHAQADEEFPYTEMGMVERIYEETTDEDCIPLYSPLWAAKGLKIKLMEEWGVGLFGEDNGFRNRVLPKRYASAIEYAERKINQ